MNKSEQMANVKVDLKVPVVEIGDPRFLTSQVFGMVQALRDTTNLLKFSLHDRGGTLTIPVETPFEPDEWRVHLMQGLNESTSAPTLVITLVAEKDMVEEAPVEGGTNEAEAAE